MSYGEDVIGISMSTSSERGSFAVSRPAFEIPLDEHMASPDARAWTRSVEEIREVSKAEFYDESPQAAPRTPSAIIHLPKTLTSQLRSVRNQ
jgi:hypothetical protein